MFLDYGYTCQYNRTTKKRGRISGKAAAAAQKSSIADIVENGIEENTRLAGSRGIHRVGYGGQQDAGCIAEWNVCQENRRASTEFSTPISHTSFREAEPTSNPYPILRGGASGRNSLQHILSPTIQMPDTPEERNSAARARTPTHQRGSYGSVAGSS